MDDKHLVPDTSYRPVVDYDSLALSSEQIHAKHVAQQRQDVSDEAARQRDLHETS